MTTPNGLYKMLRVFGCDAPFFQLARVNHHFQRNSPKLCSLNFKTTSWFVFCFDFQFREVSVCATRTVPFCRSLGAVGGPWRCMPRLSLQHGGDGMACVALDVDLLALRFQQDNCPLWSTTNNSK